jgi:hypothetical protein
MWVEHDHGGCDGRNRLLVHDCVHVVIVSGRGGKTEASAISIGRQEGPEGQMSIDKERFALGLGSGRNRGGGMVRADETDWERTGEEDATLSRREVSRLAGIGRNGCPISVRHNRNGAPHVAAESCMSTVPASRFRNQPPTPHLQTRLRDTSRLRLCCYQSITTVGSAAIGRTRFTRSRWLGDLASVVQVREDTHSSAYTVCKRRS